MVPVITPKPFIGSFAAESTPRKVPMTPLTPIGTITWIKMRKSFCESCFGRMARDLGR
jgi:hypothetical protein